MDNNWPRQRHNLLLCVAAQTTIEMDTRRALALGGLLRARGDLRRRRQIDHRPAPELSWSEMNKCCCGCCCVDDDENESRLLLALNKHGLTRNHQPAAAGRC